MIGIQYEADGKGSLKGPHADVAGMRKLLIGALDLLSVPRGLIEWPTHAILETYSYASEDIVVLADLPDYVQPTRKNIVRLAPVGLSGP